MIKPITLIWLGFYSRIFVALFSGGQLVGDSYYFHWIASTRIQLGERELDVITAGGGRVRSTACTTVLFPLPDSPTKPKISPCWISKETSFTAFTGLPGVI